jgi:hypothetical protein
MCAPFGIGIQPYLHHCGCGCMGFLEVEEEVKMLENYRKRLENMLEVVDRRLNELKKAK